MVGVWAVGHRLANLALRIGAVFGKLVGLAVLAKYGTSADVANFAVISASIGFFSYLVGMELYAPAARRYPESSDAGPVIFSRQLQFYLFVGLIIGFVWSVFAEEGLILTVLLTGNLMSIEVSRYLVAQQRPLAGGLVTLIRDLGWPVLLVSALFAGYVADVFRSALTFWALTAWAGALPLLGRFVLRYSIFSWQPGQLAMLATLLRQAVPFVMATFVVKGIFTLDRIWLSSRVSAEEMAAFVIIYGSLTAMLSLLDSAVFSLNYPRLIRLRMAGQESAFWQKSKLFSLEVITVLGFFLTIGYAGIGPLIHWLGKDSLMEFDHYYLMFAVPTAIYNLSMVSHYILYARGKDNIHMRSTVWMGGAFLFVLYFAPFVGFDFAAPELLATALTLSFSVMFVLKMLALAKERGWVKRANEIL